MSSPIWRKVEFEIPQEGETLTFIQPVKAITRTSNNTIKVRKSSCWLNLMEAQILLEDILDKVNDDVSPLVKEALKLIEDTLNEK